MTAPARRTNDHGRDTGARRMRSKVPEVTLFFWLIKVMATTVGESAADYLNETLGFGLTVTTIVMTVLLVVVLVAQFRERRYVPGIYWLAVVAISVVGTLVTDNLTDRFGVSLKLTTTLFAVVLVITFAVWQRYEGTLSIHSIYTTRREAFYWAAILFTFALGTAAGDLLAESLDIGYWRSGLLFGACIAAVLLAWRLGANSILTFWLGYILTRPLGASIGDYLSQKPGDGGLGVGTLGTSLLFLGSILVLVLYLTRSKVDQEPVGAT